MSKVVEEVTLGVDVSKRTLEICIDGQKVIVVQNKLEAVLAFLDQFCEPLVIAIEPTNVFHEMFVAQVLERGHAAYLVDGYRLSKYREAVGVRAKTDDHDAQLLRRYLLSERANLQPARPQNPAQQAIWRLIKRRAKVVKVRSQIKQSLSDLDTGDVEAEGLYRQLDRVARQLTREAIKLARELGWGEALERLQTIPGVGKLNALALHTMYRRGEFANSDQFVAFLGLDVRVRDSGTFVGRRKLTKKGDPEVRRLLFNGARSAAYYNDDWCEKKRRFMDRGMSEIQVSVIQARKIARIAFALLKTGKSYESTVHACTGS